MLTFYRCNICGNLIEMVEASGVTPICCGQPMNRLEPNTSDGIYEKHLPFSPELSESSDACSGKCSITVRVGETLHPMTDAHFIQWIVLLTDQGIYRKILAPDQPSEVNFLLSEGEQVQAIYSYCNLHGLWCRIIR